MQVHNVLVVKKMDSLIKICSGYVLSKRNYRVSHKQRKPLKLVGLSTADNYLTFDIMTSSNQSISESILYPNIHSHVCLRIMTDKSCRVVGTLRFVYYSTVR